jgi:hypothetical protein
MSIHRKRARTPLTALSIPQRLYLVPRLSLWLLPCLLVLLPQPSLADTITFYDLSDTVTVVVTNPSRVIGSSSVRVGRSEFADVTIGPPEPGARVENLEIVLYFTEPEPTIGCCVGIDEPLSDQIFIDSESLASDFANVSFISYDDGPPFVITEECGIDPCVEETGGIQPGGSLHWSDGTVDGIYFQSDVSEIPEPSSVILLATVAGLMMFVGRRRRRTLTHFP